jgi:hypothetical protein
MVDTDRRFLMKDAEKFVRLFAAHALDQADELHAAYLRERQVNPNRADEIWLREFVWRNQSEWAGIVAAHLMYLADVPMSTVKVRRDLVAVRPPESRRRLAGSRRRPWVRAA